MKILNFFKNYWYYYKVYVLIGIIVLGAAGFVIYEKASYKKPDMIIDCISDNVLFSPGDTDLICRDIENSENIKDINNDKTIKVAFNTYSAGASDNSLGADGGSAFEIVNIKMAVGNSAIIIADRDVLKRYDRYDIFTDLSDIAQKLNIPEEDRLYSSKGVLAGIRFDNRGIMKKHNLSGSEVFLTLRMPMESVDKKMTEQAPYVAEYMLR